MNRPDASAAEGGSERAGDRGVRLIAAYKFVRAGVVLALALGLFVVVVTGETEPMQGFATDVLAHFAGAWSVALAKTVLRVTQPHNLVFVALALGCDGLFTLVEGWALRRGHWWGPWLVVVGTSSLLPFEVVAIARRVHPLRVIVLVLNVAIVAYLLWRRLALRSPCSDR